MAAKGRKPTPQEAELILRLYDLRREAVLRKARMFVTTEFWPKDYDEFKAVAVAFGTEHNAFLRQVTSYWDMATAMVLEGIISEDLFYKTNAEPYFLYAKFGAYIERIRKDTNSPEFMLAIEKLATGSTQAKERVKRLQANIKARTEQLQAGAKAGR